MGSGIVSRWWPRLVCWVKGRHTWPMELHIGGSRWCGRCMEQQRREMREGYVVWVRVIEE